MAAGCTIARSQARVYLIIGESSVAGIQWKPQVRGHFGWIK